MISIDGIELPANTLWLNRHDYSGDVVTNTQTSISGVTLVSSISTRVDDTGKIITLSSTFDGKVFAVLTKPTLDQLKVSFYKTGSTLLLIYDNQQFNVRIIGFVVEPLVPAVQENDDTLYTFTFTLQVF